MKKTLLLAAVALLLAGCGIDYQGSLKLIFEGRVVDQTGNPLKGIPVKASISDGHDSDIIGIGETDSNGRYRMMFPGASEPVHLALYVNTGDSSNDMWSNMTVLNIDQDQVKDEGYRINFDDISLFPAADAVTLNITYTYMGQPQEYLMRVALEGFIDNKIVDYNYPGSFSETAENNEEYYWYYPEGQYRVAKNQTVVLRYIFSGEEHEVEIPIGETDVTYNVEL